MVWKFTGPLNPLTLARVTFHVMRDPLGTARVFWELVNAKPVTMTTTVAGTRCDPLVADSDTMYVPGCVELFVETTRPTTPGAWEETETVWRLRETLTPTRDTEAVRDTAPENPPRLFRVTVEDALLPVGVAR